MAGKNCLPRTVIEEEEEEEEEKEEGEDEEEETCCKPKAYNQRDKNSNNAYDDNTKSCTILSVY